MNYYEILGVPRTATQDEIYKKYLNLVREYHPDKFLRPDEREKAEKKLQEINEAYNVLRNAQDRRKYDETLQKEIKKKTPQEEARLYFARGQQAEQEKDNHTAVECYKRACALDDKNAQYVFDLARLQAQNPNWTRYAIENFSKALALAPTGVEYYREIIRFYLKMGMKIKAQKLAQQALNLLPNDEEFLNIAKSETQSKGGFFSKFTKKA